MNTMSKQTGFSLIELMVSLTVASLLSIAVVSAFSAQNSIYIKQAQRMQSNDDGRQSFDVLSRLIRHANAGSFTIVTTDDPNNGIDILASFSLPAGFKIWPNVDGTFADNFIFIRWADNDAGNNVANQIRIAKSNSSTTPADNLFTALSGANSGINTRISLFNLLEQAGGTNYKLTIAARSGIATNSAETYFEGTILPRN